MKEWLDTSLEVRYSSTFFLFDILFTSAIPSMQRKEFIANPLPMAVVDIVSTRKELCRRKKGRKQHD